MAGIIETIATKLIEKVDFGVARKLAKPTFWVVLVTSFTISGILIYQLWFDFGRSEKLMSTAILSKLENTPERYKALAALILSGLDDNLDQKEISAETRTFFEGLTKHQTNATSEKSALTSLSLNQKNGTPFLTMSSEHSFVMVPTRQRNVVLDATFLKHPEQRLAPSEVSVLAFIKTFDEGVKVNICSMAGVKLLNDNNTIVQTYLIAGVNIAAFCKYEETNNTAYFLPQFVPDREFSNRPYYEETLRSHPSRSGSEKATKFFHVTPHYIDTTANGFVQSFCRDIAIPPSQDSNAMFCFDVALPKSAAEAIVKEKADAFGGDVLVATCSPERGCESKEFQDDWLATNMPGQVFYSVRRHISQVIAEVLTPQYRSNINQLANIAGGINVLSDEGKRADTFTFSIPVSKRGQTVDFLVSELQVTSFEASRLLRGSIAGGAIILALMALIGAIYGYGVRVRDQAKTLDVMKGLMREFPVPYCHCDEGDRITNMNLSFARLMGFATVPQAEASLHNRFFPEILADDDSCRTYEAARQERTTNKMSAPYHVRIIQPGMDNRVVSVTIHGAPVPNPFSREQHNTQTFGLFLSPEMKELIRAELARLGARSET